MPKGAIGGHSEAGGAPGGNNAGSAGSVYNTPPGANLCAPRKTEFGHIDEIVRRIALARFDVTINLSHNGKSVRQYRAVSQDGQRERRLGAICGLPFLEHALAIEWQRRPDPQRLGGRSATYQSDAGGDSVLLRQWADDARSPD